MAKSNKIAGTILLVFFGWAFKMALSFPPRAMYFPVFVTGTGVVLSLLLLATGFFGKKGRGETAAQEVAMQETAAQETAVQETAMQETAMQEKEEGAPDSRGQKMAAVMLAAMVLYVIGMQFAGFCVSTLVFLIGSMLINYPGKADKRALVKIAVVSVGITVLIYLVFKKLLYVPLPTGFLI